MRNLGNHLCPQPRQGHWHRHGLAGCHAVQNAAPRGSQVVLTGFESLVTDAGEKDPNILLKVCLDACGALIVLLLAYGSAIAINLV